MWLKIAAALGLGVLGSAAPAAADAEPVPAWRAQSGSYDVSLPTGDKVHVAGKAVSVTPAPGRDPAFSIRHSGGDLYVIPDDRFTDDPERYNVTALHEHRPPAAPKPRASGDLVTVRVKSIARDGRPGLGLARFLNVEDALQGNAQRPLPGNPDEQCTDERWSQADCVRLRPGTYSVLGTIKTMPSWAPSTGSGKPLNYSFVGYPEIEITEDTEIVLDARKAKEVTVETPGHATKANLGAISHLMWTRGTAKGQAVADGVYVHGAKLEERVFLQPTEKIRTGTFEVYTRWRLEAPAITMRARGRSLHPMYYRADQFSDTSDQFPRLDGKARMRVADGDGPGADLRGRLALIRRKDGVSVAEQSNRAAKAGARMVAIYNDEPGVNDETGGDGTRLRVPTVRLSHEEGRALLREKNTMVQAKGVVESPYQYDLVFPENGRISENQRHVVRPRDLARIDSSYHGTGSMTTARYSSRPWETFTVAFSRPLIGAPRTRVEYVSADPETTWSASASTPEEPYNFQFPQTKIPHLVLATGDSTYRPGYRGERAWFKAPIGGAVPQLDPITRHGDLIRLHVGLADAGGNFANAVTSPFPNGFATDFRIYWNDRLVAKTAGPPRGVLRTVPGDAEYRIEYDFLNKSAWARLSPMTKTAWTFRSAHTTDVTLLPLLQIAYDADVDLRNRSRSGKLKLDIRHQDGSTTPLERLSLETSFDDGVTWTSVPVKDGVAHIKGKGPVSLRVVAEDTAGNAIEQEITRAFELH
ncbi:PA domain-containing protein [Actinomadura sp. 3N407]|uniref:PA domain-containing protein n=1 Tax=Actinomadura sp. 3N407 TaxID=3457423 RepID=UPI003FCEE108